MRPSYDRGLMTSKAVSQLKHERHQLVVTIQEEDKQKFHVKAGIEAAFAESITVVVLKEAMRSQARRSRERLSTSRSTSRSSSRTRTTCSNSKNLMTPAITSTSIR